MLHLSFKIYSGGRKCANNIEPSPKTQEIIWLAVLPTTVTADIYKTGTPLESYRRITIFPSEVKVALSRTSKGLSKSGLRKGLRVRVCTVRPRLRRLHSVLYSNSLLHFPYQKNPPLFPFFFFRIQSETWLTSI